MPAPSPWKASDLTPAVIKARDGSIQTGAGRDGSRPGDGGGGTDPVDPIGLIFSEDFDGLDDWHTGLTTNDTPENPGVPKRGQFVDEGDVLPAQTFAARNEPVYAPSKGFPDGHEVAEILASNTDKARGGTGKSFVKWRSSNDESGGAWISDGLLVYSLPEFAGVPADGLNEVYAEFYIAFSNECAQAAFEAGFGSAKLFRILHWSGGPLGEMFSYFTEDHKPDFIWGTGNTSSVYGTRNNLSMLTKGEHIDKDQMVGLPANYGLTRSSFAGSFAPSAMAGMEVGGGDTRIPDRKNGGNITTTSGVGVDLEQIFGDETTWTKVGFYVKMNSAPGVYDGVLMQWIDDKRIFISETVPWVQPGYPMVKWNQVIIGGNDLFSHYPNADEHNQWWAMDDLVVRDSIPTGRGLI